MANVNRVFGDAMTRHARDENSLGNERVVYTPLGGTARRLSAIVHWGEGDRRSNELDGVTLSQMTEIDIPTVDVPALQAGDKFTIREIDFRVSHVPFVRRGGLTTVALENMRHLEKSDGGVRRHNR